MLKRLTVHLENVKPVTIKTGKTLYGNAFGKPKKPVEETKVILNNTISVHNLTSQSDINQALNDIRKDHTIATCNKHNHNTWKSGDEMWYTSNETL